MIFLSIIYFISWTLLTLFIKVSLEKKSYKRILKSFKRFPKAYKRVLNRTKDFLNEFIKIVQMNFKILKTIFLIVQTNLKIVLFFLPIWNDTYIRCRRCWHNDVKNNIIFKDTLIPFFLGGGHFTKVLSI